jgi:integrase
MKKNPFLQVFDKQKRRVRGLWMRNDSYYVQTTVVNQSTGIKTVTKLRLDKATNLGSAKLEAAKVKQQASRGEVRYGITGQKFCDYKEHYAKVMHKAPKTLRNEILFLNQWERFFGPDFQIKSITAKSILSHRAEIVARTSPVTANLHVRALKELLKLAKTEGLIQSIPFEGIKQIPVKHKERKLMEIQDLFKMATNALRYHDRTGKQFADYISILMYSGARSTETLHLKWEHIDWNNGQIVFTGDISKGNTRRLDFNKNLKNVLLAMHTNKNNSEYLFPSFRTDQPITSFKKILNQVKAETDAYEFTFHLTRHFFISQCVMLGIDYLTIAKWVGHSDGGILIGKRYGHLNSEHLKKQADKVQF